MGGAITLAGGPKVIKGDKGERSLGEAFSHSLPAAMMSICLLQQNLLTLMD
jgi:hypothetical protein